MSRLLSLTACILLLASATGRARYRATPATPSCWAPARPLGMGSAFVALSDEATAVYWNPAGLPRLERREVQFQHAERFGGSVKHDALTAGSATSSGGFGVGILRSNVGSISITELEDPDRPAGPDNRPVVLRTDSASDLSLHLAYGRHLSTRLSVGIGLKLVWRDLAVGTGSGWGVDLGALYDFPDQGVRLGAVLRNATRTSIGYDTGTSDRIPPSLLLGAAWSRQVSSLKGRLTLSGSVHLHDEGSTLEDMQAVQIGVEYVFREQVAFRLGAEGDHFTAGAGLHVRDRFGLDVAFLENGALDNSYRISGSFFY